MWCTEWNWAALKWYSWYMCIVWTLLWRNITSTWLRDILQNYQPMHFQNVKITNKKEKVKNCSILNKTEKILQPGATGADRLDPGPIKNSSEIWMGSEFGCNIISLFISWFVLLFFRRVSLSGIHTELWRANGASL